MKSIALVHGTHRSVSIPERGAGQSPAFHFAQSGGSLPPPHPRFVRKTGSEGADRHARRHQLEVRKGPLAFAGLGAGEGQGPSPPSSEHARQQRVVQGVEAERGVEFLAEPPDIGDELIEPWIG